MNGLQVASFPWVEQDSIFGKVYSPMATIELQNNGGVWNKYEFKIDSGAVVTAMDASYADDLGFSLTGVGEKSLFGVGKNEVKVCVLDVNMRIGNRIIPKVPIAFCKVAMDESLLGRKEVFDLFGIYFNPKVRHTTFAER